MAHLFVTGVTSGIGRAVARAAVIAGHEVTGCGRRGDRLDQVAAELGDRFHGVVADVLDQGALESAVAAGRERFGPFHAVVANAGRGLDGELLDCSAEDLLRVIDVNLAGVHRTVLASRPAWATRVEVVIVSSVLSAVSVPRKGGYCASKHALDGYATALRIEVAAAGHRVTTINPGTVATEFFDAAPASGRAWTWRPKRPLTPEAVAAVILAHAQGKGGRRRFLPVGSRLLATASHLLPGLVEGSLRRRLSAMRRSEAGN